MKNSSYIALSTPYYSFDPRGKIIFTLLMCILPFFSPHLVCPKRPDTFCVGVVTHPDRSEEYHEEYKGHSSHNGIDDTSYASTGKGRGSVVEYKGEGNNHYGFSSLLGEDNQ